MADDSDPRFKQLEGILSAQYKRKISLKKAGIIALSMPYMTVEDAIKIEHVLYDAYFTQAVGMVCAGLEKKDREAVIANAVKDTFDNQVGPSIWQVVVGRKFEFNVEEEETGFLYFSVSHMKVLIFVAKAK